MLCGLNLFAGVKVGMACIAKIGPNNLGQDIPLWVIEARSLKASNKLYLKHDFTIAFPSVPFVTATGRGGLGLVDINIINVTQHYVEFAISGPSPGLTVEMHAMALDPIYNCPCPTWITGIPSPCDGGAALDPCCNEGDGAGGWQPWGWDTDDFPNGATGMPCV